MEIGIRTDALIKVYIELEDGVHGQDECIYTDLIY